MVQWLCNKQATVPCVRRNRIAYANYDLGPLLFLLYINDLRPNCSDKLTFSFFADDTNVFASASNLKTIEALVNSELEKGVNGLLFNNYSPKAK